MDKLSLDDNPIFSEKAPDGWEESFVYRLGKRRFDAILMRMHIKKKSKCRMRDLAKIVISSCDVMRIDFQEILNGFQPPNLSDELMKEVKKYRVPEKIPSLLFDKIYVVLAKPFGDELKFISLDQTVEIHLQNLVHFAFSCLKYDPYWFAKKRTSIKSQSHRLDQIMYYERLAGFYAACEDLEVGHYLPAPSKNDVKQYYRVTAHLITGDGQIGMILLPATEEMKLVTIRVTGGTPPPPGKLDFVSYAITDMEPEIGRIGYESGLYYQDTIDRIIGKIDVEIGYSMGGTIAQWRASDNPLDLSSMWLYKSPGVPMRVWEKFNSGALKRKSPLDLFLFQAKGDIVDYAGDMSLGFNAPENVRVALYELKVPGLNPHGYAFDTDNVSVEEIEEGLIDAYLSNKSKIFIEKNRKKIGKSFVLPILGYWKKLFSKNKRARINQIRGLKIEVPSPKGFNILSA